MKLSAMDWLFWVAGFLGEAALFSILIYRRRSREFFVFTTLIGFLAVKSVGLYLIYAYSSRLWYARVFYFGYLLDFILELGMVWGAARIVMRPTGSWVRDAKKQFILGGAAGLLFAAALSWMLSPPASTLLERLRVRSDLFTSLVVCELFVVMLLTAKRLGLGFRNHVFALVLGWSAWVMTAMVVDLLHGYFGTHLYFEALNNARKLAYLAALVYWTVQFWLDEPPRREISPELRNYILALHNRTKNDLDKVKVQR
ncbi:MAG: hypothetical protein ABSF70_08800 [Terracidiphilus sp.]|jgi:hypothetical protein